ncbi:MAG: hypothetical protein HY892_05945 [Deltaproteobacteria bacterium]|nr:hypothetical protein [Deltaproteobacteria bacterium]
MTSIIMLFIGLLVGWFISRSKREMTPNPFEIFYATVVLISIGFGSILFGFIPHLFLSDQIARNIGWPTGSPFQLEVGMHDGSWGILGLLSYKYRKGFIQATVIGFSVFLIMAGGNHLREMIVLGNYSPYNVQFILGDLVPAVVFLMLAYYYSKHQSDNGPTEDNNLGTAGIV